MKKVFLPCLFLMLCLHTFPQLSSIQYLSGKDKDHTVEWDFYCSGGRNSGKWTKIAVPSNWELQGFGQFNYGHDKIKSNEQGIYKYEFLTPHRNNEKTFIVFEGSMTDTKVLINGKSAGALHQGGFYQFKYEITDLLAPEGKNMLEVTVDKTSANESVNDAERKNSDFWVFGGIFRPVYLETVPSTFLERLAINAKADGSFSMEVYARNLKGNETIEAQVVNAIGESVGNPFSVKANPLAAYQLLHSDFISPKLWSAEFPNLYQVIVSVKNSQGLIHQIKQKFGFRTVELRLEDGLYVNGSKIILKGCNRHSFWPETGRTLSYDIQTMDVRLIKEMNMNAVRMSHYPPDPDFLDVCDSLGLYVLDELTGWQAKYDTTVGRRLVKELVVRDVNHPSIIFWDNGNEGGWNRALDNDFALYDPQKRTVIHPWEKFNGTDTKHYPDYKYIMESVSTGKEVFFPTEFMHGLYDGGAGAGLDDFWTLMRQHPHGAGGFIWAYLDEAVLRSDKNGIYDGDGNHAPDGIVGPHREKEASFYAIKEIWSPLFVELKSFDSLNGKLEIENRYDFTNLNQCRFTWRMMKFPLPTNKNTAGITVDSGSIVLADLKPGAKTSISVPIASKWTSADALCLTAYGPDQKEIFTWSWPLHSRFGTTLKTEAKFAISAKETKQTLIVQCDGIKYQFNKETGFIQKVMIGKKIIPLSGGPLLAGIHTSLKKFTFNRLNGQYLVETSFQGAELFNVTWVFANGNPVRLNYKYIQLGDAEFRGITFNFPEVQITGIKWLGRGPYRVWKNRLKGQQFAVWHKAYNNTITGENWNYPEFKGFHAEVKWVVIENAVSPFTIYSQSPNTFLQIGHPAKEKDALINNNVEPLFPEGDIGFLEAIPAIGTKFQGAKDLGPQSQTNHGNGEQVNGTIWLDFNHQ